ncbi:hypothetical protein [Streptomyces triticirhizae]|uniref:hypothetical protein n=1 Tax=Streptomyces triticirhizae TaxID=2483353 RepID=UPI001F40CF03|nr:hypothetical protein [Streptomyces triticirhizae]
MVYLLAPLIGGVCLVLALGLLGRCARRVLAPRWAWRTGGGGPGPGPATLWRDLAAALLALALSGYALGVLLTADWEQSPSRTCATQRFGLPEPPSDGPGAPRLREREVGLLPPSAVCHWSDGARDGVPSWINPTVLTLAVGALGAAGPWAVIRHGNCSGGARRPADHSATER